MWSATKSDIRASSSPQHRHLNPSRSIVDRRSAFHSGVEYQARQGSAVGLWP
jgi:hypothetical protein